MKPNLSMKPKNEQGGARPKKPYPICQGTHFRPSLQASQKYPENETKSDLFPISFFSRELIYPTWESSETTQKVPTVGDMWKGSQEGTPNFFVVFSNDVFFGSSNPSIVFQAKMLEIRYSPKKHIAHRIWWNIIPTEKHQETWNTPKITAQIPFWAGFSREKHGKNPWKKTSHCRIPPIAILLLLRGTPKLLERPGISSVCGGWSSSKCHMGRWHVTSWVKWVADFARNERWYSPPPLTAEHQCWSLLRESHTI